MTTKKLPTVDELRDRLASPHVASRVTALWGLGKHGPAAASAIDRIIAALDDDDVWHEKGTPDFDHQWSESFHYPARSAVLALSKVAPQEAVERVALAVARHQGRPNRILHHNAEPPDEERFAWEKPALLRFGTPLVEALRRLADGGPDELRANAAAVLKVLSS